MTTTMTLPKTPHTMATPNTHCVTHIAADIKLIANGDCGSDDSVKFGIIIIVGDGDDDDHNDDDEI
jgi:hypothetical protein